MFAAIKAEGTTTINNAAKEPEIINVAQFLKSMGAKISGEGTEKIIITGVNYLSKGQTEVIPDRIEAGTYVIMGSLIGENLKIDNIVPEHHIIQPFQQIFNNHFQYLQRNAKDNQQ